MPTRSSQPDRNASIPVDMRRWLAKLVRQSRRRATEKGLVHTLADDCAETLFHNQHGRCAITGLRFNLTRFPDILVKHPFAPSLHRRRSARGYLPENVALVCIAANFGMGEWGEEVYWSLAFASVKNEQWTRRLRNRRLPARSEADWMGEQADRIAAAERVAEALLGDDLREQQRHIAGLRRTQTLGVKGLKSAGPAAKESKRRRQQEAAGHEAEHRGT